MVYVFKNKGTFQQPVVFVFALLLKGVYLINTPVLKPIHNPGGLLVPILNKFLLPVLSPSFFTFLCISLMAASAVYANRVLQNSKMFSSRHTLVAAASLLYTSLFPQSNFQIQAFLLVPLLITMFYTIVQTYHKSKANNLLYNLGLMAATGYLLYHPLLVTIPFVFLGVAYMRPFAWREAILMLVGIATPIYLIYSFDFLTGQFMWSKHFPNFSVQNQLHLLSAYWWLALATLLFWIALSFVGWQRQLARMLIQGRKSWFALLVLSICLSALWVIFSGNHFTVIGLLSFPLGAFLSHAFTYDRITNRQNLFFWLLIIVAAIVAYGWQIDAI